MVQFRYDNLRVGLKNKGDLSNIASKKLSIPKAELINFRIIKKSIDARDKQNICFVYSVVFGVNEKYALKKLAASKMVSKYVERTERVPETAKTTTGRRPVVVGSGPAGVFAAYHLSKKGYRPLVIERGSDVDTRAAKVAEFWRSGLLDPECNVQFGEGGAGTFSDGKLTCRLNDPEMNEILKLFVECGAPEEITWLHKPHIGTDVLRIVVKNLREKIIGSGGEFIFDCSLKKVVIRNNFVCAVETSKGNIETDTVFLATGHSARDVYEMLHENGIAIVAKPFAAGVRIEHPQALIDQAQYGAHAGHPKLGAADYALVFHDKLNRRSAYSFCMCPGGQVVAAASERNSLVINGMSNFRRDSNIANSALVVTVDERDFGNYPLAGIDFQRKLEQAAFSAGGGGYYAPVQTIGDFLFARDSTFLVAPSYAPGVKKCDFRTLLPKFISETLTLALADFGRKIKGFDDNGAVMTAVETRTSSPCRIVRGLDFQSVSAHGLYPVGEGAGYAGGIMSSALDGINAARAFMYAE